MPNYFRCRKSSVRMFLAVSMMVAVVGSMAFAQGKSQPSSGEPVAPPIAAGPLTLSQTFFDVENDGLGLGVTLVPAFVDRTVTCPASHTKGCLIKVETSSQFWDIPAGTAAVESITASGGLLVHPNALVAVDSTTTGSVAGVRTFQWTIGKIPAGTSTTIDISFYVETGTAFAGYRTATIQLYFF